MSQYFTSQVVDDTPLLQDTFNLRYQVYCLERGFLPAADYPNELEIDVFDAYSVHLAVLNLQGEVAATARLVQPSGEGLPLFSHCTLYPDAPSLEAEGKRVVEVSRLSVSRKYNRRAGDAHYSLQGRTDPETGRERREGGGEIVMTLYKTLYQVSKRRGFTHWLAATEKSLQRLVARFGFPFVAIGPEIDYYGQVSPYLMDLSAFDQAILSGKYPPLATFLDGLEPQFLPVGRNPPQGSDTLP